MNYTVYEMKYKGEGYGGYCIGHDSITRAFEMGACTLEEAMAEFNERVKDNANGFYDRIVLIDNEYAFDAYEDWNIIADREFNE